MTTLSVRSDDYSIQITSRESDRFFVRIEDPQFIADTAKFSDFRIEAGRTDLAFEALRHLEANEPKVFKATRWIVADLLPTSGEKIFAGHPELVDRFDELKDLFRGFCEGTSRSLENAFLEPRAEKFDGVFLFAQEPMTVSNVLKKIFVR